MPPGNNAGGNLNLFMFEVGMLRRDPFGILPDVNIPVALHPLLTIPETITIVDRTRGTTTETHAGSVKTIAGRQLLEYTMRGTWGAENRQMALIGGTGELRAKRFHQQVVRLASSVNKDQVKANKDPFLSPFLELPLRAYDEDTCIFYVNFYDLWNGFSFECEIESYHATREARRGGAQGVIHYTMEVHEVGPVVTGGLANTLIRALFSGLTKWDTLNEVIESYSLQGLLDGLGAAAALITNQAEETFNSLQAFVTFHSGSVTGLVNGFESPENPSGNVGDENDPTALTAASRSEFLGASSELANLATELADTVAQVFSTQIRADAGQVDFSNATAEGQIDAVEVAEQIEALYAVADAARFQAAVGGLYGMSRDDYAEFITSSGQSGRGATLRSTITHTITDWDTPASLTQQYSPVTFDEILAINRLLPSEALVRGTKLLIPRSRPVGPQDRIEGLPVFGSHAGLAALGTDIYTDFRADADGDLALVSGGDCLAQGLEWLITENADELLKFLNAIPDAQVTQRRSGAEPVTLNARLLALQTRLTQLYQTDPRVSSVDAIQAALNSTGTGIDAEVTLTAINGDTLITTS